jgi:hypothetical protein
MATATAPAITRDMLEDRYVGLLHDGNNPSELQDRLDDVLWDLVAGVARRATKGPEADTSDHPFDEGIVDRCEAEVRRIILDELESRGVAR